MAMLEARGLRYQQRDDETILTGFATKNYRDSDGDLHLSVVVRISEGGEYFSLFAPLAYRVPEERAGTFLTACAMIQWRTKLIQFEYDAEDGEVRPVVEFPLEDAHLTERQVMRCLSGLVQLVDEYHPTLQTVLEDGVIDFPEANNEAMVDMLGDLLSTLSPEVLADALRRADEQRSTRRN
jgi:hypothetical protein